MHSMAVNFWLMFYLTIVIFKNNDVLCDLNDEEAHYSFIEELFGNGLSQTQVNREAKKHIASSTEDLKILFTQEKILVEKLIKKQQPHPIVKQYLQDVDVTSRHLE
jgi:hypothetical protein